MRDWRAYVRDRLVATDLRPEHAARVVRELAAQLEDFHQDALARGLSEPEADAHARAQITDWARMADDVRQANRAGRRPGLDRLADRLPPPAAVPPPGRMLMHIVSDARYAVRQLVKNPGFTVVAALTLALGVGATTAIFSVVNGVLLRPLPYAEPDALVRVHEVIPQYGRFSVAPATFLDWRAQNQVFERMMAYGSSSATFTDLDVPERVSGAIVSWDAFDLLGIPPAQGGGFTADQDLPGAPAVMVISHGMWQTRFGGDPGTVGRAIPVNGVPTTIVGVMPEGFYFPSRSAEFWRPYAIDPATASRGAHFLGVLARMKPGVELADAHTEMRAISERLGREYPENSANESAEVVGLLDQVVGSVRPALLTLLAAVGVVVLIACANVANLLLVRASVREKEVAIRSALGAAGRRLAMQMLAESVVLAFVGGALGMALAYLSIVPIRTLGASSIPRVADVSIDGTVLLFGAGASLVTGLLFGLAPAWHASRSGSGAALKDGARGSTGGASRWLRSGLLVTEVALSIVLLVGASLLLRSFDRLTSVDPGFQAERVLAFQVALPQGAYPDAGPRIAFFDGLLERLSALPGVTGAGMVQSLPISGSYVLTFDVEGRPPAQPGQETSANHRVVSPGYFDTLGVPIRRGRAFTAQDTEASEMVAVVDEAFARRHFPDEDPIGRGIDIGNGTDGYYRIVGVVADVRHSGLSADPTPTMYVPYKQDVFSGMWVMARTEGDPSQLVPLARAAVQQMDRGLPAYSMTPLSDVLSDSVAQQRFSMLLLAVFAVVALVLAAIGLYGVVAYSVSQRTREIGLRMAIGAQPGDVLRMVVGGGMKLAAVGVVIGLLGALALVRFIESMLFEVGALDLVSYAGTAAVLLAVSALACYVPARRAMRVDPLVALQGE